MASRLANASSPYLRQHADNPVDWYPWSEEPFEKAERFNVPVLISIGYAACHWCHVMAHESFEDETVGSILNDGFVSIKVDREEHPDVDHFYMSACGAMGVRGGWPLTVLATPDKKPFYIGTYLPRRSGHGRVGLVELLERVAQAWQEDRDPIHRFGEEVVEHLRALELRGERAELSEDALRETCAALSASFDQAGKGMGSAPKFPSVHQLQFLLRYANRFGDPSAEDMAVGSLKAMTRGGLFDHVGGGFHRYSTDRFWKLPHFEKMLLDQAALLDFSIDVVQVTEARFAERAALETASYVLRDMVHDDGRFYASEDADSEGGEGRFYLWSHAELARDLSGDELNHLETYWAVHPGGNVQDEATGRDTGLNILYGGPPEDDTEAAIQWTVVRDKLHRIREERPRPLRDEKLLTDWNGAMIAALARGGRALRRDDWTQAGLRAACSVLETMRLESGALTHSAFQDAASPDPGYGLLDDAAQMIRACLELFQATGDPKWLDESIALTDDMIDRYWDESQGAFFMSGAGSRMVPLRQKSLSDGAHASAASVAAMNLLTLSVLTGSPSYERTAISQLETSESLSAPVRAGFCSAMSALDFSLGPVFEIVVVEGRGSPVLHDTINRRYLPRSVVVPVVGEYREAIVKRMPHLAAYDAVDGLETVYVCRNRTCERPVTNEGELRVLLATPPHRNS